MNPIDTAVRIIYGSQRLYCSLHRSAQQNRDACLQALALLTGLTIGQLTDPEHPESIQAMDGRIDLYRSS